MTEKKEMEDIVELRRKKKGTDSAKILSLFEIILPVFVLSWVQNINNITPWLIITVA